MYKSKIEDPIQRNLLQFVLIRWMLVFVAVMLLN